MLTEIEKKIITSIQADLAVTRRPYLKIAEKLGISEDTFLTTLQDLCDRGVVRRFGATLYHQQSGFAANVMVAWQVDEDRIDAVGQKMASFSQVSHCYRRNPHDEWPYNLYTMIHAKDEESCKEIARMLSAETSIGIYTLLFSQKELKKTSMAYFPPNSET